MNEQSPEWQPFRPSSEYKEGAAFVLNQIFLSPEPEGEPVNLPEMQTRRFWEKGGVIFWVSGIEPKYIPLMIRKPEAYLVKLLRVNASEGGLIQVRSYLYYRDNGEMQVADWLYTPEEFTNMEFTSPEGKRRAEGLTEGFEQHVYTASELDYMDFLADLDSFSQSLEI